MKLKNILSIICCLVAMASCSMEDDTMMNDTSKELLNRNSDREAVLSINLSSSALLTKATEPANGDKETKLENCVLALMEGNDVLAVRTSSDITDGKVNDVTFLTKVRSGLSVIAIVNVANPADYLSATTRTALNKVVTVDPNSAASLVKQGEEAVNFPVGFGSASTAPTAENTMPVVIKVAQVAAKIQLSEFNVTYATGTIQKEKSVTLTSVSFENINKKSNVFTEATLDKDNTQGATMTKALAAGTNEIGTTVYSYANTNAASPVKMTLTFRIDDEGSMQGETVTKTYMINKSNGSTSFEGSVSDNYVNAGYLYRIKVNMTVNTHAVDTDVVCYTQDWEHNEVSVDMSEVRVNN